MKQKIEINMEADVEKKKYEIMCFYHKPGKGIEMRGNRKLLENNQIRKKLFELSHLMFLEIDYELDV